MALLFIKMGVHVLLIQIVHLDNASPTIANHHVWLPSQLDIIQINASAPMIKNVLQIFVCLIVIAHHLALDRIKRQVTILTVAIVLSTLNALQDIATLKAYVLLNALTNNPTEIMLRDAFVLMILNVKLKHVLTLHALMYFQDGAMLLSQ